MASILAFLGIMGEGAGAAAGAAGAGAGLSAGAVAGISAGGAVGATGIGMAGAAKDSSMVVPGAPTPGPYAPTGAPPPPPVAPISLAPSSTPIGPTDYMTAPARGVDYGSILSKGPGTQFGGPSGEALGTPVSTPIPATTQGPTLAQRLQQASDRYQQANDTTKQLEDNTKQTPPAAPFNPGAPTVGGPIKLSPSVAAMVNALAAHPATRTLLAARLLGVG